MHDHPWFVAAKQGDLDTIARMMSDQPEVINWTGDKGGFWPNQQTALHLAVINGRYEAVSLLLTHPDIDVNAEDANGWTPICWTFMSEAWHEHTCCSILLEDHRTRLTNLPLELMSGLLTQSHIVAVLWVLSGRHMNAGDIDQSVLDSLKTTYPGSVAWVEEYLKDPVKIRDRCRAEINWVAKAGRLFALVIFFCDGYMAMKEDAVKSNIARFFAISTRLPLELQMLLCNRYAGFPDIIITAQQREAGLKQLARSRLS